jgi:Regulator of chromosome condensation (RCC1) repeat
MKFQMGMLLVVTILFVGCDDSTYANTCGDGVVDVMEKCDGDNLEGKTCASLNFYGGKLQCTENCSLDISECQDSGQCGDGVIQSSFTEECDGDKLGGNSCSSLGYHDGEILCKSDCFLDISDCEINGRCGDGTIQTEYEQCDMQEIGSNTCISEGYTGGGTLSCDSECTFDYSGCLGIVQCGDNLAQGGEECDGTDFKGESCFSLEYYGGNLLCNSNCSLDLSECESYGWCGDSDIEAGKEVCDSTNLNEESCETLGYHGGTLACRDSCEFNITGCQIVGSCGDASIQPSFETCDGSDLNSMDCLDFGYYGGVLNCSDSCQFDYTQCSGGICGDDNVAEGDEDCDGINLNEEDCLSLGYHGGNLSCNSDCSFNLSSCTTFGSCGDGNIQSTYEECDGISLNSQDCNSFDYYGGSLACSESCEFDYTSCISVGICGDNILQSSFGEECDLTQLNSKSCISENYYGGVLGCDGSCNLDYTDCSTFGICGDNSIQSIYGEKCDGSSLGYSSDSCSTWAWSGTTFSCDSSCALDLSLCLKADKISLGKDSTIAIDSQGQWYWWGSGSTTIENGDLSAGVQLIDIASNPENDSFVALDSSGQPLSSSNNFDSPSLIDNSGGAVFTSIVMGRNHSCALDDTGKAWCWGSSDYLGGFAGNSDEPVLVTMPLGRTFISISAAFEYTCAIDDLGGGWCWGKNSQGQFGDGTTDNSITPVQVLLASGSFISISAGDRFTCGVDNSGDGWCWGQNDFGNLGDNTNDDSLIPVPVSMPLGIKFSSIVVSTGGFTCAIDESNNGWCWGDGALGVLGNGEVTDYQIPVEMVMPENTRFSKIFLGETHGCAISELGKPFCWGSNNSRKLGNGTLLNSNIPIAVMAP